MRSVFRTILAVACAGVVVMTASADRTTRSRLRVRQQQTVNRLSIDTIVPSPGMVTLSGYDKALRSSRESILITNASRRRIKCVVMEITYLDTRGRMLNKRRVEVTVDIPAGETRQVTFSSWDKQKTMYYRLTGKYRTSDGTPYDIRAIATGVLFH